MKTLTLKDIYIGMEIEDKHQLDAIYDTWIILIKNSNTENYKIGFIGKETNSESDKLYNKNCLICPVYNDSSLLDSSISNEG